MSQNPRDHESPQEPEGGHQAPQFGDDAGSGSAQPEDAAHDGATDGPAASAVGGAHRAAGDPRADDHSDAAPQAPGYEAPRYQSEAPQGGYGQAPSPSDPYGRPVSGPSPHGDAPAAGQQPYDQPSGAQPGPAPQAPGQPPYTQAPTYGAPGPGQNQNPYAQQPGPGAPQWQQNQNPYAQQPGQGGPQWNAGQHQYTAQQPGPNPYTQQPGGQWGGPGAAAAGRPFDIAGRLQRLLLVSAGLFLLLGIVQVLGRTTMAYALHLQEGAEMFGFDSSIVTQGTTWAITPGNVISWVITLALYALVLFLLNRRPGAGRITGIVLAVLGGLGAIGALFSAFTYGWVGFLVAIIAVAFIAVNVVWIVRAARTR